MAVQGGARSARRSPVRPGAGPARPAWDLTSVAIAEAKREWLAACVDGSSPARVERLYEEYRDLVIRQAALAVQGSAIHAS